MIARSYGARTPSVGGGPQVDEDVSRTAGGWTVRTPTKSPRLKVCALRCVPKHAGLTVEVVHGPPLNISKS